MQNIKCIVKDKIYIPNTPKLSKFINELKVLNTHINPKFTMQLRLKKRTFGIPKKVFTWELDGENFCVPRGDINLVNKTAKLFNIKIEWKDKTVYPEAKEEQWYLGCYLDKFQENAFKQLTKYKTGCLVSPTGSGKTNIAIAAAPYLMTPTLILVHTKELLYQTQKRYSELLNIYVGIIGDGKWDEQIITVAMIQTLTNLDIKDSAFSKKWGLVLCDEVHHGSCTTWWKVVNNLQARYKYGFSATPWRKDGMEFMIWNLIGPIRHTVTNEEVRNAGRTIKPTIITVDTDFNYQSTGPADWGQLITKLTEDKNRNKLICKTVNKALVANSEGLILTDRVKHAEILCELLKAHNPVLLTGTMDKIKREKGFAKVRSGCKLTIATTSLLGEGIDCPGWTDLFQCTPLGKSIRVQQTVGRVVRSKSGKTKATVYDFVDWNVPKLVRAFREREKLYSL